MKEAILLGQEVIADNRIYLSRRILELCKRLKDNIDNYERINTNPNDRSKYRGIRSGELIDIFFTGGFSAGKTTFLKRLFHKTIGETSPYPKTATFVKHMGGSVGNFHITFNEYDAGERNVEFKQLLRDFKLESKFDQKGTNWTQAEEISELWDTTKKIEFMNKSSQFAGAIKKIEWQHLVSKKEERTDILLQYVNLIDMPGIEGKEEHTVILNQYFHDNIPDVIVHVLEKRGPAEDELSFIYEKMCKLLDNNIKLPVFIWIFQKKQENETYEECRKISLQKPIEAFIKRKRPSSQHVDKITEILINAPKINAIGDDEDYDIAEQAMVKIIGLYYYIIGKEYVRVQKENLAETQLPEKIIAGNNPSEHYKVHDPIEYILKSINQLEPILRIMEETKVNGSIEIKEIISKFVRLWKELGLSDELKVKGTETYEEVIKMHLKKILGYTEKDNSFVLKEQRKRMIETLVKDISDKGKHVRKEGFIGTRTYIKPDLDFWLGGELKKYLYSQEISDSIYYIQALALLEAYHKNILGKYYIRRFESSLIDNLKADLDGIQENISMFEDIDVNTIENILMSRKL